MDSVNNLPYRTIILSNIGAKNSDITDFNKCIIYLKSPILSNAGSEIINFLII